MLSRSARITRAEAYARMRHVPPYKVRRRGRDAERRLREIVVLCGPFSRAAKLMRSLTEV